MANRLLTKDTLIVFDVETTGLIAGYHSMIQLGAVAYRNGKEISHFVGSLKEVPGFARSEGTMQFWNQHLSGWKAIRATAEDPASVMKRFYEWAIELPDRKSVV
jgi:DNA polymerase III epsilon subunit-like protein